MSIGSIFLGLALLVLVVVYLSYPLLGQGNPEKGRLSGRTLLLEQKEALLDQLRALDFDYETGKLPEQLYTPQRAQLLQETTAVLQQLDTLPGARQPVADADIEAAIARARQTKMSTPAPDDAAIEAMVSRARRSSTVSVAVANGNGRVNFCPQCGKAIQAGDKFCTTCGHKLAA